jgi:hypothetical protein
MINITQRQSMFLMLGLMSVGSFLILLTLLFTGGEPSTLVGVAAGVLFTVALLYVYWRGWSTRAMWWWRSSPC